MRNRCLRVENQHMVNFSSAVWENMTSHLTSKLFQRRRETALKVQVLITIQQKTKRRGQGQQSELSPEPVPQTGWSSTCTLEAWGYRGPSSMLWQKWQHANILTIMCFEFCCSSISKWPDTFYLTAYFKSWIENMNWQIYTTCFRTQISEIIC